MGFCSGQIFRTLVAAIYMHNYLSCPARTTQPQFQMVTPTLKASYIVWMRQQLRFRQLMKPKVAQKAYLKGIWSAYGERTADNELGRIFTNAPLRMPEQFLAETIAPSRARYKWRDH